MREAQGISAESGSGHLVSGTRSTVAGTSAFEAELPLLPGFGCRGVACRAQWRSRALRSVEGLGAVAVLVAADRFTAEGAFPSLDIGPKQLGSIFFFV